MRREIDEGKYYFEDEVDIFSLPSCMRFKHVGKGKLIHDYSGFTVEGEYKGKKYSVHRAVAGMYGLHIEYDYCYVRPDDCIDISTDKDSIYCYPTKQNVVTKLSFATEELYKKKMEDRARRRAERAKAKEEIAKSEV